MYVLLIGRCMLLIQLQSTNALNAIYEIERFRTLILIYKASLSKSSVH